MAGRVSAATQGLPNTSTLYCHTTRGHAGASSRHNARAASRQQQLVACPEDRGRHVEGSSHEPNNASPWYVILPNGKQFQLQELCTRAGRQSVWDCEATELLSTAVPVLVEGQPSLHSSAAADQQLSGPQQGQQAQQEHVSWSQHQQESTADEQQQLPPLSRDHLRRLQRQHQVLQQQVMREQQLHLQQQLADFSQQAAAQYSGTVDTPAANAWQQQQQQQAQEHADPSAQPWPVQLQVPVGTQAKQPWLQQPLAELVKAPQTVPDAAAAVNPVALLDPAGAEPQSPALEETDMFAVVHVAPGDPALHSPASAGAAAGPLMGDSAAVGESTPAAGQEQSSVDDLEVTLPSAAFAAAAGAMQTGLLPPPVLALTTPAPHGAAAHAEGLLSWSFAEPGSTLTAAAGEVAGVAGVAADAAGGGEAAAAAAPLSPHLTSRLPDAGAVHELRQHQHQHQHQQQQETSGMSAEELTAVAQAVSSTTPTAEAVEATAPAASTPLDSMGLAVHQSEAAVEAEPADAVVPQLAVLSTDSPAAPLEVASVAPPPVLPVQPLPLPQHKRQEQVQHIALNAVSATGHQQQRVKQTQHTQQQESARAAASSSSVASSSSSSTASNDSRESVLMHQIAQTRNCRELCLLVMQQTSYQAEQHGAHGLQVNLGDWTPAVVAAAMTRFKELTPYTYVAALKAKQKREVAHQQRQQYPAPLGTKGTWQHNSRHSSSTGSNQEGHSSGCSQHHSAWDTDQDTVDLNNPGQHMKLLMRVYFRLMDLMELQLTQVPAEALAAAAVCASALLGRSCRIKQWWRGARGFLVLGEARLRLKEGSLPAKTAIQLCYSYSHCDYAPSELLQELVQQVQHTPDVLQQLTLTTLCRFTFCITQHRAQLTGLNAAAVTAAVLQALPLQDISSAAGLAASVKALGGRVYDLVMLLRHMCQLNFEPPAGVLELMPALLSSMSTMTMQELSMVLHVAVAWELPNKAELASAAATAALSAAGLSHQQLPLEQHSVDSGSSSAGPQQQRGPVARSAADAVLLLHHFRRLGHKPPQQLVHHLLAFIAPRLHQLSLIQANLLHAVLVHTWPDSMQCQLLMEGCVSYWLVPQQQSTGTGSESDCSCVGPQYRLRPSLLRLPLLQLKALLVSAGRFGVLAAQVGQQDEKQQEALPQHMQQQQEQKQQQEDDKVMLKQQLMIALQGSEAEQVNQQQAAQGEQQHAVQHQPQGAGHVQCASLVPAQQAASTKAAAASTQSAHTNSSSRSNDRQQEGTICADRPGRNAAATFIATVLAHLTPAVFAEWPADLALALLWSAARLKLQPSQELLSAGCVALMAGMRRDIAARQLVLLVWTAASLKMTDTAFLEVLCGRIAQCTNQIAPPSIASAAWALVQLRCPHTVVLSVLSRELLKPVPWMSGQQAFTVKHWCRPTPVPQTPRRQALQQQEAGDFQDATASFCDRYSDADAWGSWQRPMPKHMYDGPGRSLSLQQKARKFTKLGLRRSFNPNKLSLTVAVNPTLGCVHQQYLLHMHPRVRQLRAADVAKLVSSCCLAGWAPPQLFSVLAARAEELMNEMGPAELAQVMWAYSAAGCNMRSLVRAAASRATVLARCGAFTTSSQPTVLLKSLQALRGLVPEVHRALLAELKRLK